MIDWQKNDGEKVIQRIKSTANDQLKIVIITYEPSEVLSIAEELGVTKVIDKPLFKSTLFDLLTELSGKTENLQIQKNKTYDFSGKKVILAEDNAMNMEIAKSILQSTGLEIKCCWNGKEALDAVEGSESGTYSAVLMDVHMPIMDGLTATKAIRDSAHPDAKTIPIIAMTADAFAENIAETKNAGMNDHISKPIDVQLLFETLNRFFST